MYAWCSCCYYLTLEQGHPQGQGHSQVWQGKACCSNYTDYCVQV